MKKLKYLIIIPSLLISCISDLNRENEEIKKWYDAKLELPQIDSLLYQDSIKVHTINRYKLRITTLIWGECKSCVEELYKWNKLLEISDNNEQLNIDFYLYAPDLSFFHSNYYNKKLYKYPLLLDKNFYYIDKNKLPFDNRMYQTFLLDSNNKVILTGNPILSKELENLYISEIKKRLK